MSQKYETIDYHGYTVNQALTDFEQLIRNNTSMTIKTITGKGKIRDEIIKFLQRNDIEWIFHDTSKGCILVYLGDE